ncbi:MAG: hypothetical protein IJJ40_05190 [Clostridia bacterium]|nr:hypothetical protein [Clostridia bacterium]
MIKGTPELIKGRREEILFSFKISYGKSLELMEKILNRHISKMSKEDTKRFIYAFFP